MGFRAARPSRSGPVLRDTPLGGPRSSLTGNPLPGASAALAHARSAYSAAMQPRDPCPSILLGLLGAVSGACTQSAARPLEAKVDMVTIGAPEDGELRGAQEIRVSAAGLAPLLLRPRSDSDEDLLPIVTEVRPVGSTRAVLSGFVSYGGGTTRHVAFLVEARDGRLLLQDELQSDGSPFFVPWEFASGPDGDALRISACAGADCTHTASPDLRTERWSVDGEEVLARHLGEVAARQIQVREGRFQLAPHR